MFRAASFNTKVSVLRSQSPFYRMQEPAASPQQQQQQPAAGTAGIELKPSGANLLLGQQHLEARGKFVAAHPVGPARRGASPLQQQQPVAVADGG